MTNAEKMRAEFEKAAVKQGRSIERFDANNPNHLTDDPEFAVRDYRTWPTEEVWRAFQIGWAASQVEQHSARLGGPGSAGAKQAQAVSEKLRAEIWNRARGAQYPAQPGALPTVPYKGNADGLESIEPTGSEPAPAAGMVARWSIDTSTGRRILMNENCSVIEGDMADYVLALIQTHEQPSANLQGATLYSLAAEWAQQCLRADHRQFSPTEQAKIDKARGEFMAGLRSYLAHIEFALSETIEGRGATLLAEVRAVLAEGKLL